MRSIRGTPAAMRGSCEEEEWQRHGDPRSLHERAPWRCSSSRDAAPLEDRRTCSGMLAGGPFEEAASQHVHVNVIHALSTVVARVQDGPEAALGDAFRARHVTSQQ